MTEKAKRDKIIKYLCEVCPPNKTCVISAQQIAQHFGGKYLFSIAELDKIFCQLEKNNYLQIVASGDKKGYYYCIRLKSKGQTFVSDRQEQKRSMFFVCLNALCFGGVLLVVGVLLKTIFGG